jgi:hypothetical protein
MPPFDAFSHYLAYLSTDQETFRELRDTYTGVLVPGTIAAWQRQGTGGFVLTLSATADAPPYMIDPRFPLFQQFLEEPKVSHLALAELFQDSALIRSSAPTPDQFTEDRIARLGKAWAEFNSGYDTTSNEKFDKYAERLGEPVTPEYAQGPEAMLAPYFACDGTDDPWWPKSTQLFEQTNAAAADGMPCIRVVCACDSAALDSLLEDVGGPEQLAIWVSGLNEHKAKAFELVDYRWAISDADARGQEVFALYGGFFSVLLGTEGLRGAAHGVGFGEHRDWLELSESGAPPARFYLRRVHRYVMQDLAQVWFDLDPDLTKCPCPFCDGRPPLALEYHELMEHSVWCRAEEIKMWHGGDLSEAADALEQEYEALMQTIGQAPLPKQIRKRSLQTLEHLPVWVEALRAERSA